MTEPTETIRTLETVASGDPALLPFVLAQLEASPARPELIDIASRWAVGLAGLRTTAARATRDLDKLQQRHVRCAWDPARVLRMPNLAALLDFAAARRQRLGTTKLAAVERRVRSAYESAECRRRVTNFLSGDPGQISPDFLAEFLPVRTARSHAV